MLQGNILQFQHLSNFKSIHDFNNHMEAFLAVHKKDFSEKELICFKALYCFAAKVFGVSNVSINTLLKAIKERNEGINVSESTFHRMKRKVVNLGILTVKTTTRKNGSQSSNLWIFNQYLNKNDTPIEQENLSNKESSKTTLIPQENYQKSKTSKIKDLKERSNDTFGKEFVPSYVPKRFVDFIGNFFHSAAEIKEFWSIICYQTRYYSHYLTEDKVNLGINAMRQLVFAIKLGKRINNQYGFYFGICDKLLTADYKSIIKEMLDSA